jgi:hypothetical protein
LETGRSCRPASIMTVFSACGIRLCDRGSATTCAIQRTICAICPMICAIRRPICANHHGMICANRRKTCAICPPSFAIGRTICASHRAWRTCALRRATACESLRVQRRRPLHPPSRRPRPSPSHLHPCRRPACRRYPVPCSELPPGRASQQLCLWSERRMRRKRGQSLARTTEERRTRRFVFWEADEYASIRRDKKAGPPPTKRHSVISVSPWLATALFPVCFEFLR